MTNSSSLSKGAFPQSATDYRFQNKTLEETANALLQLWETDPYLLKTPGNEKDILEIIGQSTSTLLEALAILQDSDTTSEDISAFQSFIENRLPSIAQDCYCSNIGEGKIAQEYTAARNTITSYRRAEIIHVDFANRRSPR